MVDNLTLDDPGGDNSVARKPSWQNDGFGDRQGFESQLQKWVFR